MSSIGSTDDFLIRPVFVPQEAFANNYTLSGEHFFSGNAVLQYSLAFIDLSD